jgi:hypothetical protein
MGIARGNSALFKFQISNVCTLFIHEHRGGDGGGGLKGYPPPPWEPFLTPIWGKNSKISRFFLQNSELFQYFF